MFAGLPKRKRKQQQYIRAVRNLLRQTLQLSDEEVQNHNRVWDEWLASSDRKDGDFCELFHKKIHDGFKARVLTILLAPGYGFMPYLPANWFDRFMWRGVLEYWEVKLTNLSPLLQEFSLGILETNRQFGVTNHTQPFCLMQHAVNELILEKLARAPIDDPTAERWFGQYYFFTTYGNKYDCYRPYGDLLAADVPDEWKGRASAEMQKRIVARTEGKASPVHSFDQPLLDYLYRSSFYARSETRRLDLGLFASHISFIASVGSYDDNFLCNLRDELPQIRKLFADAGELEKLEPSLHALEQSVLEYEQRSEREAKSRLLVAQVRQADEKVRSNAEKNLLKKMR